jgi:ABC-type multidrug transport system fused ATPase/permease subunit
MATTNPSEATPLVISSEPTDPETPNNASIQQEYPRGADHDEEPTWSEVMDRLIPYLKPVDRKHMVRAIAALISAVFGKVLDVLPPLAIRYAVDAISDAGDGPASVQPILTAILVYFGLRLVSMINGAGQDLAQRTVALDAERRFAVTTFAHLQTLSLSYHLEKHIGEITRIMNRGSDSISTVISSFLFYLAPTLLETIVVSAVFWKLGTPAVALSTIAAVVVYLTFTILVTKTRIDFRRKLNEASDAVGQKETETLVNYETVAMFGRTHYEIQQYSHLRQDYKDRRVEMLGLFAVLEMGQKFIKLCGMCAGLLIAGMATVYGYGPNNEKLLSPGSFVVIQIYIEQLFQPLTQLGWQCERIVSRIGFFQQQHATLVLI